MSKPKYIPIPKAAEAEAEPKPYYPPVLIEDGHTRTVQIDGMVGIHPPCEFTYRAFRGIEGARWFGMVFSKDEGDQGRLNHMMALRIEKWDLGHPLSAETMEKLDSTIYQKILYIILGRQAPDNEVLRGEKIDKPTSDNAMEAGDGGNSGAG